MRKILRHVRGRTPRPAAKGTRTWAADRDAFVPPTSAAAAAGGNNTPSRGKKILRKNNELKCQVNNAWSGSLLAPASTPPYPHCMYTHTHAVVNLAMCERILMYMLEGTEGKANPY